MMVVLEGRRMGLGLFEGRRRLDWRVVRANAAGSSRRASVGGRRGQFTRWRRSILLAAAESRERGEGVCSFKRRRLLRQVRVRLRRTALWGDRAVVEQGVEIHGVAVCSGAVVCLRDGTQTHSWRGESWEEEHGGHTASKRHRQRAEKRQRRGGRLQMQKTAVSTLRAWRAEADRTIGERGSKCMQPTPLPLPGPSACENCTLTNGCTLSRYLLQTARPPDARRGARLSVSL